MHLFGGFLGTLIVVYVLQKVGISPRTLPRKMFLLAFVVISVFAIGVVWELWEIFIGFTDPFDKMVQVDTIIDLVIGIIGSLVAFIFYDKRLRTKAE
jgi:membrane associated rhomboid family serine protease